MFPVIKGYKNKLDPTLLEGGYKRSRVKFQKSEIELEPIYDWSKRHFLNLFVEFFTWPCILYITLRYIVEFLGSINLTFKNDVLSNYAVGILLIFRSVNIFANIFLCSTSA